MKSPMNRPTFAPLAALVLMPVLLAGAGCAPMGSTAPSAILERVADGEYDVGIHYPSKRTRYVMIVDEDEETLALTNRPVTNRPAVAGQESGAAQTAPEPTAPQRSDRVLAPCTETAGNWYRHTPAGYVCVGETGTGG